MAPGRAYRTEASGNLWERRRARPRAVRLVAGATALLTALGLAQAQPAGAAPAAGSAPARVAQAPDPGTPDEAATPDRVSDPDRKLGSGWRRSADRAMTTSGDETGLHILVADEADAYRWHTVATLAEPGVDTDQWIGQACLTGSARRAVVVYAPRQYANREPLFNAGAFAAVVDLSTGAVTKLTERVSLAYHNPGCGAGETAVLSRLEMPAGTDGGDAHTWLGVVNAATGEVSGVRHPAGQVSSAIPVRGRVIAAKGTALVEVAGSGAPKVLAELGAVPFRVLPDGTDGVAYQTEHGDDVRLHRFRSGHDTVVASVPSGTVKLRPGAGGRVYAVGGKATDRVGRRLPVGWTAVDAAPDSTMSSTGALTVVTAVTEQEAAGSLAAGNAEADDAGAVPEDGRPDQVAIDARLHDGGALAFTVQPGLGDGLERAGEQAREQGLTTQATTDPSTVPYDPDRTCAVPRNDATMQTYQPTPLQVEWAADLAVKGKLASVTRAANWQNLGLPAYSPQGLFPKPVLQGFPDRTVPAQILLGILAQESNLRQASWHTVDGSAGNPLTSAGFYGLTNSDPETINWNNVDCGYGVAQVTTGMRLADTGVTMTDLQQKAVALDYATNIAAGLQILGQKWNETRSYGLIANDGDPIYLENWWFAIWAYNTGLWLPSSSGTTPWGVGWANNPANPNYPADRKPYLNAPLDVPGYDDQVGYDNSRHPNSWSYPERVIGWAYTSMMRYNYIDETYQSTYKAAVSPTGEHIQSHPSRATFCTPGQNECDLSAPAHQPGQYPTEPAGACQRDDLKCWWHTSASWTDCLTYCGFEVLRYTTVDPKPYATNPYPAQCATTGLPTGARIIDDISTTTALGPEGCTPTWTKGGTFSFSFGSVVNSAGYTVYPSKVDFHQIGGGFGGHFWFTHTIKASGNADLKVTGRWTINPVNAWTRVFVHVPDHGAHTQQADYQVHSVASGNHHRAIPTRYEANTWISIGVFDFTGTDSPYIELSNFTEDGVGVHDIAWDAIAVQPLAAKPRQFMVGMGDSYSSGEGTFEFYRVSNQYGDDGNYEGSSKNACRRSPKTWSRVTTLPGATAPIASAADGYDPNLDYHLVACSGAIANNVTTANSDTPFSWGQYGELPQIGQGFLDENTTLVTLSIGGNDAGFSEVLQDCIAGDLDCSDGDEADERLETVRTTVPAKVREVMRQIGRAAPHATVVLMGYPVLFDSTLQCTDPALTQNEAGYLEEVAVALARGTVDNQGVVDPEGRGRMYGADVITDFTGLASCSIDGSDYLNGLKLEVDLPGLPDDDGDPGTAGVSMNSFHPTVLGYEYYGQLLTQKLTQVGFHW